jgi:hypothetical protein
VRTRSKGFICKKSLRFAQAVLKELREVRLVHALSDSTDANLMDHLKQA